MYNCSSHAFVNNTGCSGSLYGSELMYYKYYYVYLLNCTANMTVADKSSIATFNDIFRQSYTSSYVYY